VTVCEPPAAIVPFVQLAVNTVKLFVIEIPLTVSGALPAFFILKTRVVWLPTCMFPNARLPLSSMTRVVGDGGGDGNDGVLQLLLHPTAPSNHSPTTELRFSLII
jgi:hypothetical protein